MAERNTPTRVNREAGISDGQAFGFAEGVDSYSHPMYVKPTQLRWLENGVVKGSILQCRPGYKTRLAFTLTPGTPFYAWWVTAGQPTIHPQMLAPFQQIGGQWNLVVGISGGLWTVGINHDGSLAAPVVIQGTNFAPTADQLYWANTTQVNSIFAGVYINNIVPRNLLVIQDGWNRPCLWDGAIATVPNPQKNWTQDSVGNTYYTDGFNGTRIGKWMAWSGNRLFLSNGNNVYASDIGDPTHFTEELSLNSLPVMAYPSEVTGLYDRGLSGATNSELFVFTRSTTNTIFSGAQARLPSAYAAGWVNTQNFQAVLFDNVGCISGKSVVAHRGLLYWMSEGGIVSFDSAGTVYTTQNLPPIDNEESISKRLKGPDTSISCGGWNDSFVFWSVPVGPVTNGRRYNGHTQVLDRQTTVVRVIGFTGPIAYGTMGWNGVWTGIRPVEWANVHIGGIMRSYALSMDTDGVVRIWEAFQGNRMDNGHPIPWYWEGRAHPMGNSVFENAAFRYCRVLLDQIIGNLTVTLDWKGLRGTWKTILNAFNVTATPGSILSPVPATQPSTQFPFATPAYSPFQNGTPSRSFVLQSRDLVSPSSRGQSPPCTSQGVESPLPDTTDHAFSIRGTMLGRAAVVAYRIAADAIPDDTEGNIIPSEEGFNVVPGDGCPYPVPGTTPTYKFADAPQQDSFVSTVAETGTGELYSSPTS